MEPSAFHEVQRFRQTWVWALTLLVCVLPVGLMLWGVYQQLVLGKTFGDNPASDRGLIVLAILVIVIAGAIVWLVGFSILTTEVSRRGIRVRFFPFHRSWREFRPEEIEEVRVGKYRPIVEYGGWGLRLGMKGWAYNVRGNEGAEIRFRNGKNLLIGTQKANELALALRGIGITVRRDG